MTTIETFPLFSFSFFDDENDENKTLHVILHMFIHPLYDKLNLTQNRQCESGATHKTTMMKKKERC
jgi:hypothetical protein